MHRKRLAAMFVLAWLTPTFANAKTDRPPNVVFIISDDLNTDIGCYGNSQVETPNIDRLAARGVRFDHAYCQFSLCGPSRNSMLTGLYPDSTGIVRNLQIFRQTIPQHHSLPQLFRLNGYLTAGLGKLYHYNVPESVGTLGDDDPASWELESNPAGCDRMVEEPEIFSLKEGSYGAFPSWLASSRDDKQHTDGMIASDAQWILQRLSQPDQRPGFVGIGFFRPHTPYVAPKKYFEPYDLADMPTNRWADDDQSDLPPMALESRREFMETFSEDLRREAIQAYYASTSFMDAQVGRVLDAIDESGLSENTIVVFTSDHGYHLGDHGLWLKYSLFEQSARVPLIIAGPGIAKGKTCESPVGLIDLYPTLASMCGVELIDAVQGQDMTSLLKDPSLPGRGYALTQVTRNPGRTRMGYSIRTDRFRFTQWESGSEGEELYDHISDPHELTNVINEPAYANELPKLKRKLEQAVAASRPADGSRPEVGPSIPWTPSLILD